MSKIVKIYHYNGKLTKLKDILEHEGIFGVSEKQFLDFENENGIKNRDILFNSFKDDYTNYEKISSSDKLGSNSRTFSPIIFALPSEYVTQFILTSESTLQVPNDDYSAFLSNQILQLANSPQYRDNFITKSNPRISVFVWCKALNGIGEYKENSIINITPFIQDINTNNAKNGGNFSMALVPVLATLRYGSDGQPLKWQFEEKNLKTYK